MKNSKFNIIKVGVFTVLATLALNTSYAQQSEAQWPFYIAFEDATGARDTLWFLIDTEATYPFGISGLYGEAPIEPDTDNFQVWFLHPLDVQSGNIYDTWVGPETTTVFDTEFFGQNFVLPIQIRWDSTLFTSDFLYETGDPVNRAYFDNQYFFLVNNGWDSVFELTLTDHAELPYFRWGDGQHFPIFIGFERGPIVPWVSTENIELNEVSVYPNPTAGLLNIEFSNTVSGTLKFYDSKGKLVLTENVSSDSKQIDLQNEADGLYYAVYEDGER